MEGAFKLVALVLGLSVVATGCAGISQRPIGHATTAMRGIEVEIPPQPLECVPYARARSGIRIHGDAWTWWQRASGRYIRSHVPRPGAVIVFSRSSGPPGGHVAVVRAVSSAHEIRVDHANWLGLGRIYLGDPVIDVSARHDWSLVRVWNPTAGNWGGHSYPISGFVGPESARLSLQDPES